MKEKVIIWGCGGTGRKIYNQIKNNVDVLYFVDSDLSKQNTTYDNINIIAPEKLPTITYERLIIGTLCCQDILRNLEQYQISKNKVDISYVDSTNKAKVTFLENLAKLYRYIYPNTIYATAEAGVFQGEFAADINKLFPNSPLYLFDTFEGFDERDFQYETNDTCMLTKGHFNITSEDVVYNKMVNKQNVKILKGYFPETVTDDILNQKFIFVNLDMDLYKPTLDGLRIFYPRMADKGVILIHAFFDDSYPNVKKAIFDYEREINTKLYKLPIGDGQSIAIIK